MLRSIVVLHAFNGQVVTLDFSTMHDAIVVNIEAGSKEKSFLVPGVRMADIVLAATGRGNHIDGIPDFCQCNDCVQKRLDRLADTIVNRKPIGRPAKV